jgi:hypothetical protein
MLTSVSKCQVLGICTYSTCFFFFVFFCRGGRGAVSSSSSSGTRFRFGAEGTFVTVARAVRVDTGGALRADTGGACSSSELVSEEDDEEGLTDEARVSWVVMRQGMVSEMVQSSTDTALGHFENEQERE